MLFVAPTAVESVLLVVLVCGAAVLGNAGGRRVAKAGGAETRVASAGLMQGALLGFVGLLLAFGLTMAVGRYDARRAAVVEEANAIGTSYLRAQTLAEPERSASLRALVRYADSRVALSKAVPRSGRFTQARAVSVATQNELWAAGGAAVAKAAQDTAPRLYLESLNQLIDMDTTRTAALENRVPESVLWLQVIGAAGSIGALGFTFGLHGRGRATAVVGSILAVFILSVTFDLDRPVRGLIRVPDGALVATRTSMDGPPAFGGPIR